MSVPDGGARAAWRPEDSFRLALRDGGRSAFEIEFAGVPGVNRAELVLAKRVTCVLARYNGGGKASPGHLVQPPLDGARD